MGRAVTLSDLSPSAPSAEVVRTAITGSELSQMAADMVKLGASATWRDAVPRGSDCYLFAVNGAGTLTVSAQSHALPHQSFATIKEGTAFELTNGSDAPLDIIRVIAPPDAGDLAGFTEDVAIADRSAIPFVEIPEQRKRRQYIVGSHAAKTDRAHAMIVTYVGDTMTGLHHHPNAESMFVLLDGTLDFTVNGDHVMVGPGQVTYFAMNDVHALRPAPGVDHVAFLEFHVPAGFSTVKHAS
jgi:mannose-6-phosphate isomerase-like protein (cupin superfamily)